MAKINLTKRKIESIENPAKGRVEHLDEKIAGLRLMITRTGSRSWYWLRKVNGRDKRVRIGGYPDLSPEQARDEAEILNAKRAKGEPIEERRTEMTLCELWDEYLERHAKQYKKTWQEDENKWNRYLRRWKRWKLSEFNRKVISSWHSDLKKKNGLYSANRALALLRKMFNFATDDLDWIGQNPCKGVKPFREESRDRFLSPVELKSLWNALDDEEQIFQDFFRFLLLAGQRRQNTLEMKWEQIDFQSGTWRIPSTKNGLRQYVSLPESALDILRSRLMVRENEYVFPSYGRTGHLTNPKTAWERICTRAGIADVRIHDLRRTLGSYAAMAGHSLPMIGKILGHKSLQATQVYARIGQDSTREAHSTTADAIMLIVTNIEDSELTPIPA